MGVPPRGPRPAEPPPRVGASHAEGSVYRPHERTSRLRFATPPAWVSVLGILGGSAAVALLAFGIPPKAPLLPGLPPGGLGTFLSAWSFLLVPVLVGSLATTPLARAFGGKLRPRRSLLLGVFGLLLVGGILLWWRLLSVFLGPFPVEGPLLLGFGLMLWIRQLTLVGVSHRVHVRSLPAAMVLPLLGYLWAWAFLATSPLPVAVAEGTAFFLLSFGGAAALVSATDRPMLREFGQGGTSLLRPLMEHMSDRDPGASAQMEDFFDGVSTRGDLDLGVLAFRRGDRTRLAWVTPSVHPGPFAELGSSDLPAKLAKALRGPDVAEVLVTHAPSTHAQDIPTRAELDKVIAKLRELLGVAEGPPGGDSGALLCSPLVSPHPGSLARAQVLGDCVLLVLTQAPGPTDDIDYALAEMIRDEARRQGFRHAFVVDAHNSFVENRGDIPFGSPEGFRLVNDAKDAMLAARSKARPSSLRLGFAQRRGFTPADHGMGGEGLSVVLLECAGVRTAYALFDANNLQEGLRDPLVKVLERAVEGSGEVMTTDNHVVHEVQGGMNPLGLRRSLPDLSSDLEAVAREAVASLAPAELRTAEAKISGVRVLGPGVTTRLMTALADSFAIFWLFFLSSLTLAALAGALILALLHG